MKEDDLYQKKRGNMVFSVYMVGVTSMTSPPLPLGKKTQKDALAPKKYT